ncbi:hypothetical protein HK096_003450 [Nowakowskiella sp. JEL0078]|nr:hypothetical protein HK096_003450 [Nowakowskiella sp. JEL0078]
MADNSAHLVSLKVMRLSKPNFPVVNQISYLNSENILDSSLGTTEPIDETSKEILYAWNNRLETVLSSSFPNSKAASVTTRVSFPPLEPIDSPIPPTSQTDSSPVALLRNVNIPSLLALPSSFGNIFLGETFSSYLCINNESGTAVQDVGIKAELQTVTQRFTLCDTLAIVTATHGTETTVGSRVPLLPSQSAEFMINHEIKELGVHILVCSVHYSVSGSGERKFFRKFFKFQVLNPLSVKTKINSIPDGRVFLEAQVQNVTPITMFLERMKFEPSDSFSYVDLNAIGNVSDMPISTLESGIQGLSIKESVFGKKDYLNSQDMRQYLFMLVPKSPRDMIARTTTALGKLDIIWRTLFGQTGRLQTSQLSRKPQIVDDLEIIPLKLPENIRAEQPFILLCRVYNNLPTETAKIIVVGVKSKMSSILLRGTSDRYVGEIPPMESMDVTLEFFPLLSGLHKITGLKIVEMKTGVGKEVENLTDVFVNQNEIL